MTTHQQDEGSTASACPSESDPLGIAQRWCYDILAEILSSIRHEANQPLAAISANSNAALRWLGRPVPNLDEARHAIGRTVIDANRAAELLAKTREMVPRRQAAASESVDLNAVLEETARLSSRSIRVLGSSIQLTLAPDVPPFMGDPAQIQQILVNLLINAAQAMGECTGARTVHLSSARGDDAALILVADSGSGVTGDVEQLFAPFYTTRNNALGMGLPVARSLAMAQGGTLTGENKGSGALFTLRLPTGAR